MHGKRCAVSALKIAGPHFMFGARWSGRFTFAEASTITRDNQSVIGGFMYQVFDGFLTTDTWYKDHPNDNERFYSALDKVVRNPDFGAENLGNYIRAKKNILRDNEDHRDFSSATDKLVSNAWAVREYLQATGQL